MRSSELRAPLVTPTGRGRRRAGPGGMRRAGRLRELLVSGVIDSFGMALGWTVVVLVATARGGLAEAALYNAAMLGGVVLSAPVTGWLAHRLDGRTLLRGAAGVEAVLRLAVLWGLLAGAPSWSVAAGVVLMHIAAWAGFAGMRAEVTAVDASPRSMTRYAVSIAGVEAGGTALAALLPVGNAAHPTGWLLTAVFVVYIGSLLPTVLTARRARIAHDLRTPGTTRPPLAASVTTTIPLIAASTPHAEAANAPLWGSTPPGGPALPTHASATPTAWGSTPPGEPALPTQAPTTPRAWGSTAPGEPGSLSAASAFRLTPVATLQLAPEVAAKPRGRGRHAGPEPQTWRLPAPRLLLAGGAVMLVSAGPTLLAVPVTAELHGGAWVAGAAVAFSLGTLLSTTAVASIGKLRLPAVLRWSLWGLGMLAGWIFAPAFAPMVLVAQFAAGLCQTAFEGDMDARVAAVAPAGSVTRDLAYSASVRALGGSIAVRLMPMMVAAPAIGAVASGAALVLGTVTLIIWAGLTTAPHLFRRLAH